MLKWNPLIIYSHSSCSKPVWVSIFCWKGNFFFAGLHWLPYYWRSGHTHSLKYLICVQQKIETGLEQHEGELLMTEFYFWWTIPLNSWSLSRNKLQSESYYTATHQINKYVTIKYRFEFTFFYILTCVWTLTGWNALHEFCQELFLFVSLQRGACVSLLCSAQPESLLVIKSCLWCPVFQCK